MSTYNNNRRTILRTAVYGALIIIISAALISCDLLLPPRSEQVDVDGAVITHKLIIEIEGEGTVEPEVGVHEYEEGTIVDLEATADKGWEFYAWTGDDAFDLSSVQQEETTINMTEDKRITAFFTDEPEDKHHELDIETTGFFGADGTVEDLTGHPPYPLGFEVELKAVPDDPEKQTFTHWAKENSGTVPQAGNYFSHPESPITRFRIPGHPFILRAFFTTRSEWVEPGEFDYDHNNFGQQITGQYGVHYDFWDISKVEEGGAINFYFHARNIPDRFKVYYGDAKLFDEEYFDANKKSYEIFNSKWVSAHPDSFIDPALYVPDPKRHDWHDNVVSSDWRTWQSVTGGKYEFIIQKEEEKDVLIIEVEGRDSGTYWDYQLDKSDEVPSIDPEIIQDFIPEDRKNRGDPVTGEIYPLEPEFLTIHDTENTNGGADAMAHANYLKGDEAANIPVSWHFTVDDKRIVQHLPLDEVGWHATDGKYGPGNRNSIGIEICMNKDGDREKAEANAIWLVGYLIEKVDTLLPFPDCMKQHYDWSWKHCPQWIREGRYHNWDSFLNECEREIERR